MPVMAKRDLLELMERLKPEDRELKEGIQVQSDNSDMAEYPLTPTARRFMADNPAFFNFLIGPLASGKTFALMKKIWSVGVSLPVEGNGVIQSRFYVVRKTMGELYSTTLKSFVEATPSCYNYKVAKTDGGYVVNAENDINIGGVIRRCVSEIIFKSVSTHTIGNMLSLNLTAGFLNEVRELPIEVLEMLFARTGRYPSNAGERITGMIFADGNITDVRHWLHDYYKRENAGDRNVRFYMYPSALAKNAEYPTPQSRQYISGLMKSKPNANWRRVYIENKWGNAGSGKACYPLYNEERHLIKLPEARHFPIYLGIDGGKNAAFVLFQERELRRLYIMDCWAVDMVGNENMPLVQSAPLAAEFFARKYPPHSWRWLISSADPGLNSSGQNDNVKSIDIIRKAFAKYDLRVALANAPGNKPEGRIEAVNNALQQPHPSGGYYLMISPECTWVSRCMTLYEFPRNNTMQADGSFIYKDTPLKNAESHTAEAVQYGVLHPHRRGDVFGNPVERIWNQRQMEIAARVSHLVPENPFRPVRGAGGSHGGGDVFDLGDLGEF